MTPRKYGCGLFLLVVAGLITFWSMTARVGPFKILLLNRRMQFVGRVVDQYGQPVRGAHVTIQFGQAVPIGMFQRVTEDVYTTDRHGFFSIRWRVGTDQLVTRIEKRGYEYLTGNNLKVTGWDYIQPRGPAPSWNAPAVFHLRKRGETTHLQRGQVPIGCEVDQAGLTFGCDMVQGCRVSPERVQNPSINGEPLCCDILSKGLWNPKNHTWTVVLSSGTPGGGLMISDQLLYVAPETGYQPSLTLAPTGEPSRWDRWGNHKDEHPGLRYIYLRSRTPYVYARIDLGEDFDLNDRPFVWKVLPGETYEYQLSNGYVINPYGDRVLDEEPDLPFDTRLELDETVRRAYRFNVNGRPPKPDIAKLRKPAGWW